MHEGGRHDEGTLGWSRSCFGVGLGLPEGGVGKRMCSLALAFLDITEAKFIHGTR